MEGEGGLTEELWSLPRMIPNFWDDGGTIFRRKGKRLTYPKLLTNLHSKYEVK